MGVWVEVAEDLEPLLRSELDSHLECLHLFLDGSDHALEPGDPIEQEPVLVPKVVERVGRAVAHQGADLVEPESQLPVEQDLL